VLARKGAAGWVEVFLGLAMIATPIVLTAQRRRQLRELEARARAAREAEEARNRKMLADYTAALERIAADRSDDALAALERERGALTLPYEIWSAAARETVLRLGFDELAKGGPAAARIVDRTAAAAGLTADDTRTLKRDIYSTFVWHLLADDRLGSAQETQLAAFRDALGVEAGDDASIEQFRRLRELDIHNAPKVACSIDLAFREYCILQTDGLALTNRRLVVQEKRPLSIELPQIDEVSVDADEGTVVIRSTVKLLRLPVAEPILTAAMVELAGELEQKPKGFA
jgi:hypothetical protein